jgi:hypothetical protein
MQHSADDSHSFLLLGFHWLGLWLRLRLNINHFVSIKNKMPEHYNHCVCARKESQYLAQVKNSIVVDQRYIIRTFVWATSGAITFGGYLPDCGDPEKDEGQQIGNNSNVEATSIR